MNKKGANNGYVLCISLENDPQSFLENEANELLIFDRFDEIYTYCDEQDIDISKVLVHEVETLENTNNLGKLFSFDNIEEVEF